MTNDYYKHLFDKRWIKKRDKIIKRDGGFCTVCGSKKSLVVHHTYYLSSYVLPWTYPDDSLLTLCKKCHKEYHETHELTIYHYHSDRFPRLPKKKHKKGIIPQKKKRKCVFPLDELQKERGILVYRKRMSTKV